MNTELDRRAEATKLLDELLGHWGDSRPASPGAILAAAWAARRSGGRRTPARSSRGSTARRAG